jgi:hypothetical protein
MRWTSNAAKPKTSPLINTDNTDTSASALSTGRNSQAVWSETTEKERREAQGSRAARIRSSILIMNKKKL